MTIFLALILIALLVFFGLKTLCETSQGRSFAGRRTLAKMSRWQRKRADAWARPPLKQMVSLTERLVYLDEAAASKLSKTLFRAGLEINPREYTARKYLIAAFGISLMTLSIVLQFYFGIVLALLITAYAMMRQRDLLSAQAQKQAYAIAQELPRFVRTICRSLQSDRDLYNVFVSYRKVAGRELGGELDILMAEMRSGNVQTALAHFEGRLGTPEAFRLCAALREMSLGIDQTAALNYMAGDMARQAMENIRKELSLRPGKMRRTYYPSVAVCIAMIMYVLVVYVVNNFNNLF